MATTVGTHATGAGAEHHAHEQSFWRRYIFSTDHKVIGIQYMIAAWIMAAVGGFMAMLMRAQLGFPGRSWPLLQALMPGAFQDGKMSPAFYYGLVTMHGTIMIFFFLTIILSGGFGNFLIPLQVGARDMAFPWLNMLSFWLVPPAMAVLLASFAVQGGAPGTGWTAYPPLSAVPGLAPGTGLGQTLWLLSILILILAMLAGGLNYITTIINMRAPGLSMGRLPLTIWGMLITAIIGVLAFPVLMAGAIMLLFDRVGQTHFFLPFATESGGRVLDLGGGDPLLWQHLFWFFGHPEVYILILPVMGMVSDIMATNARKPIFGYRFMVGSMAAIALLSFLVWGHHMFPSGMNPLLGTGFMITTLLIAIPSAIKTFNWLATLWRGRIRFTPAMLFAIGFVSLFVTGGLTGLLLASPPIDVYFHDTYFVVAHFHFVMASASLFGVFAATYHWFPKMTGRLMDERLGRLHFWLTLVGIYGTFYPMHFLGTAGMMRRIFSPSMYQFLNGLEGLNAFVSLAAFFLGAAQLLFVYNVVASLVRGRRAEQNPWRANTLEWLAPSPAPHLNWGRELPVVYRWPYEYSVPGAAQDFVPQWQPEPAAARGSQAGGD
ncbi:MAG: cbb3-type cytochrome c oxidase subunit I [Clostridia bacterium]|nr:cbb3-type cytochrome c oxidase subunit I [Clostridia bacterium]